jgi:competence ComEA-like helix-hairpin-helix protein
MTKGARHAVSARFAPTRRSYYLRCMRVRPLLLALLLATPLVAADTLRLNQATEEQLVGLGCSPSQAVQIINYRKENGDFLQVEELLAVPQMSRETFEKVRAKVTVDE